MTPPSISLSLDCLSRLLRTLSGDELRVVLWAVSQDRAVTTHETGEALELHVDTVRRALRRAARELDVVPVGARTGPGARALYRLAESTIVGSSTRDESTIVRSSTPPAALVDPTRARAPAISSISEEVSTRKRSLQGSFVRCATPDPERTNDPGLRSSESTSAVAAELVELALELWPPPAIRSERVARYYLARIVLLGEPSATIAELRRYLRAAKTDLASTGFPLAVACRPGTFLAWLTRTRRREAANDAPRKLPATATGRPEMPAQPPKWADVQALPVARPQRR